LSHDTPDAPALRTLGRLTRGALHEISNPLVALVGSAELALGELEPGTKLHERVALTQRTGTEIAEIVRALQAFVRLQAEPPAEVSVGAAAADAVALVERVTPTHGRTFSVSGDATVVAAPGELRARIVDLLLGALDDTEDGAAVELTVGDGVVAATGGRELSL
jgi:signal transduction histidine kinase